MVEVLSGKLETGRRHFRVDEREVASAKPRRESPLYLGVRFLCAAFAAFGFALEGRTALPCIDFSHDDGRQVVVAQGTESLFHGQPSSAILDDNRTIFCVWPYNHGGYGGMMAKSTDAGRTWTRIDELLPQAAVKLFVECPMIHYLVDQNGKKRLWIWWGFRAQDETDAHTVGGSDARRAVARAITTDSCPGVMSEDDGASWTVRTPLGTDFRNVLPFQGMIALGQRGSYVGFYHRGPEGCIDASPLEVCAANTTDGGLNWSAPRVIAAKSGYDLCEPFAVRSPDGTEIAVIMRENTRKHPSQVIFSTDEGQTWSEPVDVPEGLTGDRHQGVMLADGRLVVCFRDYDPASPYYCHYVAWIGPYSALHGGDALGAYKVRLFDNSYSTQKLGDCGYSGVHLLPGNEIVCTTYGQCDPNPIKKSIVSMRFKVAEADFAVTNALSSSAPVAWFRADTGIVTDAAGNVVSWANNGSLKSGELPGVSAASASSKIRLVTSEKLGNRPAVRFSGNVYGAAEGNESLVSSGLTDLDIAWGTHDLTVFAVFNVSDVNTPGIFSLALDKNVTRFGLDAHATLFQRRLNCFYKDSYILTQNTYDADIPSIVSGYKIGTGTTGALFSNSLKETSLKTAAAGTPQAAKFRIGQGQDDGYFNGDIAEIRVYNTALKPHERFRIEAEMAAEYGIDLKPDSSTTISAALLKRGNPASFGYQPDGGATVTAVPVSGTSGKLTVSFAETPDATKNTLVYLACGEEDGETVWSVAGAASARGLPILLTVALDRDDSAPYLLRNTGSGWETVQVQKSKGVYALPSGWKNGLYKVSAERPKPPPRVSPVAWFRGDAGVETNADGNVVSWANGGSLKSGELPGVSAASASSKIRLVASEKLGNRPAVRFSGNVYGAASGNESLVSAGATDLDIAWGTHDLTVFAVFNVSVVNTPGIFSLALDKSVTRFGLDAHANDHIRRLNCFNKDSYLVTQNTYDADIPSIVSGYKIGTGTEGALFSNALKETSQKSPAGGTPLAAKFRIGQGQDDGYFNGDIAEIRIYNTALKPHERFQIEAEMAAEYGIDLRPDSSTTISAALLKRNDSAAFGYQPDGGAASSSFPVSGWSGTLGVSFAETPDATKNTLVYFAGNGATDPRRTAWCLAGAAAARQVPVTLHFVTDRNSSVRYLWRDTGSGWETVGGPVTGGVHTLPAGWKNGLYRASRWTAEEGEKFGLIISIR